MIGAGIIGTVILGFIQDKTIDRNISEYDQKNNTELHDHYVTETKQSIFGTYQAIDAAKLDRAAEQDKNVVASVREGAKKEALKTIAIFPIGMLITYLLLMLYFKQRGGYKVVVLPGDKSSSIVEENVT